MEVHELRAEIERLHRRLLEVDAQLTSEDHIHARECMALRADKNAEIERLREQLASLQASSGYEAAIAQVEIERLSAAVDAKIIEASEMRLEIERLHKALQKIADLIDSEADEPLDDAIAIARAALEPMP